MEQQVKDTIKKDSWFLCITYLIRYFGDALFFSFYQVFILSKGLGEDKLGIITALIPIIIVFSSPIWNMFAKNANVNKKIMQVITIIEGILIILFGHLSTFEIILLFFFFIAIIDTPFYSLMDGYTAVFGNVYRIEYAKIRRFGSIAYIIGCAIGAILIKEIGYTNTFLISGIFYIITTISFRFIKPISDGEFKKREKQSFKVIIKNHSFLFYASIYILMVGTASIGNNFYNAYLVNNRALPEHYCGYIMAYGVCMEVIVTTLLTKFGYKIKIGWLYTLIALVYLLKYTSITLNLSTPYIIGFAGFYGMAQGAIIYIHVKYLIKLVGNEYITTSILFISIINSIYTSIGNIVVGHFIERSGYFIPYLVLTTCGILSLILFIIRIKLEKKEKNYA